jgi:copper chaperone
MWTKLPTGPEQSRSLWFVSLGDMNEATYSVTGMTCDHCVRAVQSEVGKVPGVASVAVDLVAGEVTVQSEGPVDSAAVRAAVEEAGFELTA